MFLKNLLVALAFCLCLVLPTMASEHSFQFNSNISIRLETSENLNIRIGELVVGNMQSPSYDLVFDKTTQVCGLVPISEFGIGSPQIANDFRGNASILMYFGEGTALIAGLTKDKQSTAVKQILLKEFAWFNVTTREEKSTLTVKQIQ